jgi:siderophore synthetase component
MVGEYVFSNAHNFSFTPEFAISFYLSYFAAQEASVAPKVSATRQVI